MKQIQFRGFRLKGPFAIFGALLVAIVVIALLAVFALGILLFVGVAFVVGSIASLFFPKLRMRRTYTQWTRTRGTGRDAPIDGTFRVVEPAHDPAPPRDRIKGDV